MTISAKKAITDKRHQAKLDRIVIQPYKQEGAAIRAAASAAGESLQGYILQACRERMERDSAPKDDPETATLKKLFAEQVNGLPTK